MVERRSSIVDWNPSTERTVRAASGCLPIRSYSPAIGLKRVVKWLAKPTPEVKRAVCHYQREIVSLSERKGGGEDVHMTDSVKAFVSLINFSVICSRIPK
jgi:hypothetical protein